jgi:hypothetical protein
MLLRRKVTLRRPEQLLRLAMPNCLDIRRNTETLNPPAELTEAE